MGKIAFVFAGQGAQKPGMGRELYEDNPAAREVFDRLETLRPGTLAQCFEGPAEELNITVNTQPCLFAVDLACARALMAAGVAPQGAAGFSLGEIPALAVCGLLSEDAAFAKEALDMGFVASFSGIVTFKTAQDIQEAARRQPADAILVETDAPYLAPLPHRGRRNEPSYVAHTADFVATLRGEDPEALRWKTTENACRLLGVAPPDGPLVSP